MTTPRPHLRWTLPLWVYAPHFPSGIQGQDMLLPAPVLTWHKGVIAWAEELIRLTRVAADGNTRITGMPTAGLLPGQPAYLPTGRHMLPKLLTDPGFITAGKGERGLASGPVLAWHHNVLELASALSVMHRVTVDENERLKQGLRDWQTDVSRRRHQQPH